MALDPKAQAALALHRFGTGPRAGSIAAIASDPRGALLAELDRPDAGRIANPELLDQRGRRARGVCVPAGAACRAAGRTGRAASRSARRWFAAGDKAGGPAGHAAGAAAQSRSRHAAAALSRRSQGAHQCRARRRDRLCRAARLVLVEPFLRVGGQGQCAPDLRRLRARGHPRQHARPLRRYAARRRIPSGDADLSRQCPLDRPRTRSPASGRSAG